MAEFNLLDPAYTEIRHTVAGAAVVKGELVALNETNAFYMVDAAIGDVTAVITESPKVAVEKTTGETWVEGEALYHVVATSKVSNVAGANVLIGYCLEGAASAATEGFSTFDGYAAFLKA